MGRLEELIHEEMKEVVICGEHLLSGEAYEKAVNKRVRNIIDNCKREGLILPPRIYCKVTGLKYASCPREKVMDLLPDVDLKVCKSCPHIPRKEKDHAK